MEKIAYEVYTVYMKQQSNATVEVVLSRTPLTIQFEVVHPLLFLRHKQHTNLCRQHCTNLRVLVFSTMRWILRAHAHSGNGLQ